MTNTFPNPSAPAPAPHRGVYSCQGPGLGRRPAEQPDPGSDGGNSLPFASWLSLSVLLTRRPRSERGSALPSWRNHGAKAFLLEPAWRPHHATRWAVKPSTQLLSGRCSRCCCACISQGPWARRALRVKGKDARSPSLLQLPGPLGWGQPPGVPFEEPSSLPYSGRDQNVEPFPARE